VTTVLERDLGLQLNAEKTQITTHGKGYTFLGFDLSSRYARMRAKSVEKFKDKVRTLTVRKHNLDQKVITKLNQVIRGTAKYFVTDFSNCRWQYQKLDSWIRMRLRSMKMKRKSYNDNYKYRNIYFRKNLGLLSLEDFCLAMRKDSEWLLAGAISIGVAR